MLYFLCLYKLLVLGNRYFQNVAVARIFRQVPILFSVGYNIYLEPIRNPSSKAEMRTFRQNNSV